LNGRFISSVNFVAILKKKIENYLNEKNIKNLEIADIGSGGGCPGIPLSIAFPEYSVRSLYPQAYIKLSLKSKEKQCYVWRLKLRKPFSDTYLSSIDDFKRLTPFHTNYPIPTDYQFYDIPNNQNLILALSNSRYVYLIQIKC
jgi:hypothetical protein